MALTDYSNGGGLSAADVAAVVGNNGNGFGFGNENGGLFWLLVLFLFGFGNGGWGNGGYGGYANIGSEIYPWMNQSQQINDGFRDQMINGNIQGIQNSVISGFGDTALGIAGINQNICQTGNGIVSAVNGAQNAVVQQMYANQIAGMNQNFANQTAMLQGFNGLQAEFANCCCENRLGLANLGADVAREACADRQAVSEGLMNLTAQNNQNTNALMNTINGGIQSLKDQMCQDKIDAKNEEIANLRTQLNMQNLAASQAAQTAQLIADNTAQTQYVVNRVAPYPVPSYNVPNPFGNGCGCGYNTGCCNA